jgi:hypothetical protein
MSEQVDRQLGETPVRQTARRRGPRKLRLRRRPPQSREPRRSAQKPEGHPIDRQIPGHDPFQGKDLLDDRGRSDRESGRPVQLEEGENGEMTSGKAGPSGHQRGAGGAPVEAEATGR